MVHAIHVLWGCLVALFWAGTTHGGDTCCPDSWLAYKGSCYLFDDEEKSDWPSAWNYCKIKNSDLAAIETENESKFVKFFARKLFKDNSEVRNNTAFWLGASDRDIEGIWKWISKDEELTYTEWDGAIYTSRQEASYTLINDQPNKHPDNHEDCLALNGLYNFGWHDGKCNERVGYALCEKAGSGGSGSGNGMQIIG